MGNLKNIVKIIALTVVILLLGMIRYASAQNTGAGPYLNSWHTYRVVIGNSADLREWEIINHDTTKVRPLVNGMPWVSIAALNGSNADISICFTDSVFNTTETWYLRYRETSAVTGSCISARRFTINLTENTFYLTMAADDSLCKPQEGQVFNWNQLNGVPYTCSFAYLVTMHKDAAFTINNWSFDGTLTFDIMNHTIVSYTADVVTANGGSITALTDVGGIYGIANDGIFGVRVSNPVTPTLTEVTVRITLTLRGYVYDGVTATLTLTNGITLSGSSGNTKTSDNLGRPTAGPPDNVADPALRDREQSVTFEPLPPTTNIVMNY